VEHARGVPAGAGAPQLGMAFASQVGGGLKVFLLACALPAFAATHYVTVAGLGGEPDYEQRFTTLANEIDKLLRGSAGESTVTTLHGPEATREKIRAAMGDVARKAKADDALVVMLIGHGTFDGSEYKVNIPGPDLTAVELASLMDRVPASRQLFVNMTSASGGSLAFVQKPNRVVIAATRTGSERNATVFSRYWVEALRDSSVDTDKNEAVSALEAFRFADQRTVRYFESQKRLATEHAVLEDTGKGEPVRAPSPENGQGLIAGGFTLLRLGAAQKAAADPQKKMLFDRKEELERAIDKLKYEKAALPPELYRKQLSELLLDLARVQEELDK
ncbi:MAG: hypothetical protein ACRD44_08595, partial [Bryobacteraceae bacterium]